MRMNAPADAARDPPGPTQHTTGTGDALLADAVEPWRVGAHQGARTPVVRHRTERGRQVPLPPRQAHVDGAVDLARVAPDRLAVAVQHGSLAGELLGRDERHVP